MIEDMYGIDDEEIVINAPKEKNEIKHGSKTVMLIVDGKQIMVPSMAYIKSIENENELLNNQIKKLNFKLGNQAIHLKNIMRDIVSLRRELNEKMDNYE